MCKKNKIKIANSVKIFLKNENINGDTKFSKLVNFKKFIGIQKKNCQKILSNYKHMTIGGYGAARSGPTLALNFGASKYLSMIFDDHKFKTNKYTPLNGLFVYPTTKILTYKPAVCVVLAYLHLKKIIKKNKKYLDNGGKFLAMYPKVQLISKKNYYRFI